MHTKFSTCDVMNTKFVKNIIVNKCLNPITIVRYTENNFNKRKFSYIKNFINLLQGY